MKRAKYIFIFFLLFTLFAATAPANARQDANRSRRESVDKIRIVSVSAAAPIIDGAANEFTVEIEYALESMDEGSIAIGFNTDDAQKSQTRNQFDYA